MCTEVSLAVPPTYNQNYNKWFGHSKSQCRVLPPSKFNGRILEPLPFYFDNSCNCSPVTSIVRKATENKYLVRCRNRKN